MNRNDDFDLISMSRSARHDMEDISSQSYTDISSNSKRSAKKKRKAEKAVKKGAGRRKSTRRLRL